MSDLHDKPTNNAAPEPGTPRHPDRAIDREISKWRWELERRKGETSGAERVCYLAAIRQLDAASNLVGVAAEFAYKADDERIRAEFERGEHRG